MKFNKYNLYHYFVYLYGYFLFNLILFFFKNKIAYQNKDTVLYGHKFYGNLKSLYEVLFRNNLNCYFLTLDYKNYKKLKIAKVNVLYGLKISDLIKVIKCKIFVTDHGTHYFKKLINFDEKIFIDVNHGLPMQKWNEELMSQWYEFTEVWLMSKMHKKIYLETFKYKNKDNLFITGYGRWDYIKKYNNSTHKEEIKTNLKIKYNLSLNKQSVMYAPTWIHNKKLLKDEIMHPKNMEFLKQLNKIAKKLQIEIIFRPHLNTVFSKKEKKFINSLESIKFMPQSIFDNAEDFMILSDLLITDYSSISFDYIFLKRPVIFLNVSSSFNLGLFNEDKLRFGKIVDYERIEYFLKKYLLDSTLYFEECPQHYDTLNSIDDDFNSLASDKYYKRIKELLKK
jgi:CDP-glycerol glycerophosphotransferase (TagB/SpsB family)